MKPLGTYGQHHLISILFVGSASLVFVGVLMFTYRVFLHGRIVPGFVRWERGLIALGAIIGALGFAFLTTRQWSAGERAVSSAAWGVLALGTALIVFAEVRVVFGLASTLEPSVPLPELGGQIHSSCWGWR